MRRTCLVALLVMLTVAASGCGGTDDAAASSDLVVRSADGSATLTFPPSALPEGVEAGDIRLSLVNGGEAEVRDARGEPLLGYVLEPSGTQFLEPLTFAATVPVQSLGDGFVVPHVMQSSGDGPETELVPPEEVQVQWSQEASGFVVTAAITHFSRIYVDDDGLFIARSAPPKPRSFAVGESFDWSFEITTQEWRYSNEHRDVIQSVGNGTTFRVMPRYDGHTRGRLQPDKFRIPNEAVRVERGYRAALTFTCAEAGPDTPVLSGGVRISYTWQVESRPRGQEFARPYISREQRTTWVIDPDLSSYNCVAPATGATPGAAGSASPTPTATRQPGVAEGAIRAADPMKLYPPNGFDEVEVLIIDGEHYPTVQFHQAAPDACEAYHWHGGPARSLQGGTVRDTRPGSCGFGTVEELPVTRVWVLSSLWQEFRASGAR